MNNNINPYDTIDHISYPYKQSQPEHLFTLGKLFGMTPHKIENAKVLELGCGSGGNLYPLAESYPKSTFIGIDSSKKQVERGNKIITELDLKNIQLKEMSILSIDAKFGKFDYIICHGVFSSVSKEVQEKIFKIFQHNLNKDGIAYLAYNTYPGWNMLKDIRDLMLFHTSSLDTPSDKIFQARSILKFMVDGLEQDDTPYSKFLRTEAQSLYQKPDSFLYHEFLEKENLPIYFHEIIKMAQHHKLSYLSDTEISLMHPINLNEKLAKPLSTVNNLIQTEQYMDFIRNRRVRCSLFCHETININRRIEENWIDPFYISTAMITQGTINDAILEQGIQIQFKTQGVAYQASDRISKIAMKILIESKLKPISYNSLCEKVTQFSLGKDKVTPLEIKEIQSHLDTHFNLNRLFLSGIIQIHSESDAKRYTTIVPKLPKTSLTASYQATVQDIVTNLRHEGVRLSFFERLLLPYVDGKHSSSDLVNILQEKIKEGTLKLETNNEVLTDKAKELEALSLSVKMALQNFADNALIVYSAE